MKKPKHMSGLLAFIFLSLGLVFVIVGCLCLINMIKPSAASAVQDPVTMGMIFLIIGLACCGVQIILSLINHKQENLHKELLTTGTKLTGTVERVYLQKWTQFGTTSPFRICYTYSHQGKTYHHKSCLLWDKPNFIKDDPIEIYVNNLGQSTIKF